MRTVAIGALLGGLCCLTAAAGNQATEQAKQLHRKSLAQETQIEGYTCAKGVAWFYADGRLNECGVPRDTYFGVAHIPAGSWINLREDGRPDFVFLKRDTEIGGVTCSGGNWLLGPSEGASTVFYPSGKLQQCWLAGDQSIQGVPCMTSGFIGMFGDGAQRGGGANFYESGKLKSCTLARDYAGLKRGQRFAQTP
jgi:hypothetical protein